MSEAIKLFNAETVFSVVFFLLTIGTGTWFAKSGWPWLTKHMERRQQFDYELKKQRIESQAESDRRWQETTAKMATNFADLRGELGIFGAKLNVMLDSIERMITKINGN